MHPQPDPQVLIVGAGPTGLVMAIELRRRHIDCRIIERRGGPSQTSRAITVHARTLEILEDMGVAPRFLHGGVRNDGYIFNFLGSDHKPRLDYTRLPTRFPYVLMFNQNETEKILRDHLEHNLGLAVEWSTELTAIEQSEDGQVTATLSHRDNPGAKDESLHPNWVIASDGLHSPTREAVGIKYEGSEYDGLVMQMIDAKLTNFAGSDHLLHYYMSKDTFLMIGKLAGPNHRVLVSAQGDAREIERQDLISPIVSLHLPHVSSGTPEWKTTWEIWIRKADRYREGQVFLCGESAHVHSVAGGQGWNVCLQDAYNLAWKLALVVQNRARPELLDTYEREREPVTDQVIEGSSSVHEIILAHGGGLSERMALTETDGWQDNAVARISGLSYNYRGLIDVPSGTPDAYDPAIGDRLPDITLSEHLRLHELIAHARFTLLILLNVVTGEPLRRAAQVRESVDKRYRSTVRVELIAPSVPHPWAGVLPIADPAGAVRAGLNATHADAGEYVLVRPDGYIGYRCPGARPELLDAFLDTYLIAE